MNQQAYSLKELLVCNGARLLEDKKSVFVGTGLPMIAAMLAQKTHAPHILIVFEGGSLGPLMRELPISVADSRTFHKAIAASSMHDVMSLSQQGYVDYGFLGAAQMDVYGNINTTVIGNHELPRVRLPGSGGANDVGSFSDKLIYMIASQSKRTFVNKVDFLTTPGYLSGPGAREEAGLPEGAGPYRVITQLGIYDFESKTKRLRLISLHPGATIEMVQENSSFEILLADEINTSYVPTDNDLTLLHQQIDPAGLVLGK